MKYPTPKDRFNIEDFNGNFRELDKRVTDQSDYNNLKNKPCGESATGGDTLNWDGDMTGREVMDLGNGLYYCRVSDAVPTITDLANGCSISQHIGGTIQSSDVHANIEDLGGGFMLIVDIIMVVPTDNYNLDGVIVPLKGTYFLSAPEENIYTVSFTIPNFTGFPTTKKLDVKYLPESHQFGEAMVEIMPETEVVGVETDEVDAEGVYQVTIDGSKFHGDEDSLIIAFDGVDYICKVDMSAGIPVYGNLGIIGVGADTGEPFLIAAPMRACYLKDANTHTLKISSNGVQKIDSKYIDFKVTFYRNLNPQDPYFYTDEAWTNKASYADLKNAVKNGNIVVRVAQGGVVLMEHIPVFVSFSVGDYGRIGIIESSSTLQLTMLYTAEYTP